MIFYFSGTGNSEWVAKQLALKLEDEAINMMDVIGKNFTFSKNDRVGVVYPVYAWAPPVVVMEFVKSLKAQEAFVFGVCTYGGEPGNAMKVLTKGIHLDSAYGLLMPSNYVIGMSVDSKEVAQKKVKDAEMRLEHMAEAVRKREPQFEVVPGALAGLKTALAAPAFNKFARNTKHFRTESSCNGCGICVGLCPTKTISLVDGRPVWGKECYQCLACINRCPQRAIEYGKVSVGKGRYYFDKEV